MSEHKAREAREARLTHAQAVKIEERAMALAIGATMLYSTFANEWSHDRAAVEAVAAASGILAEAKRRAEIDVLAEAAE